MRARLYLAAAGVWVAAWSLSASTDDAGGERRARSRAAEHLLTSTSLFSEGRGLHSVPYLWQFWKGALSVVDGVPVVRGSVSDVPVSRWGLVSLGGPLAGVVEREHERIPVATTTCVVCHSGRAAGRYYIGLGNKNIDVTQLGRDGHRLMRLWSAARPDRWQSDAERRLEQSALDLYSQLGDPNLGNLTQGLVAVSFIKGWFYRVLNRPVPAAMPRQQVKVPAFWGYGAKEHVGKFADGFGDGVGWLAMVELAGGQSPSTVLRNHDLLRRLNAAIGDLVPPPYPFDIDAGLALAGADVFSRNCEQCHGRYGRDRAGLPVYRAPQHVTWARVQTDADRIAVIDAGFPTLVDSNPLSAIIRRGPLADAAPGYVAPRLDAIWARFPYLHNGSVPSLQALLSPEADRPAAFGLEDAGEAHRFDRRTIGLTVPAAGSRQARALAAAGARGARAVYDVRRVGHSNRGHRFGTMLAPDLKRALIEYLKTL